MKLIRTRSIAAPVGSIEPFKKTTEQDLIKNDVLTFTTKVKWKGKGKLADKQKGQVTSGAVKSCL